LDVLAIAGAVCVKLPAKVFEICYLVPVEASKKIELICLEIEDRYLQNKF
jgi:hypothetical protein